MQYHIITYGCQMNKSDSERVAAVLEKMGYKKTSQTKGADLIVFNMCSVRQKPVDKIKNQIFRLRSAGYGKQTKTKKPKIVLTGCILPKDEKILSPAVDFVLNIKDLPNWPKLIRTAGRNIPVSSLPRNDKTMETSKNLSYLKIKPIYQTFPMAFVPISSGCNNFCAYCVVPFTRGKEMHRPPTEILKEVKMLVAKKYNQIILLGENVNSYPNFVNLLKKITALRGDFKVSFIAANPKNFTDELINEIAINPKLEKYIHLPLQSGDNQILKKMKRPYTKERYLKLVEKIKKKIPEIKIATDIIVGFPGETKKQFQNTVSVFKKVGFYQAYIAKYSPRPGTAAFSLKNNVSEKEKARREEVLRQILSEQKTCFKTEKSPCLKTNGLTASIYRDKMKDNKMIVILGPTASGKTEFAIKLAKKFNGEIISADSRQIYKNLNIGTAKPSQNQKTKTLEQNQNNKQSKTIKNQKAFIVNNIPHYLIDIIEPNKKFSVAEYQRLAVNLIKDIQKRGKTPFLVGGTAFYIYSVVEGWQLPKMKNNLALRKKLEKKSAEQLFKILKKLDKERANNIEKNNKRRLIRAIEIAESLGKVPKLKKNPLFDCLILGINIAKEELKKRIAKRVEKMIKKNLEKEVRGLVKKYGFASILKETIGYAEWLPYLKNTLKYGGHSALKQSAKSDKNKKIWKENVIEQIKKNTFQFSKRQMTWFKRDRRIHWVKTLKEAEKLIINFLN